MQHDPSDTEFTEFMAEQSAALNENSDEFANRYGFEHNCRCDKDFEEGNVGVVPACWVSMVDDALVALVLHRNILRSISTGIVDDPAALAQEFFVSGG